MRPRPTQGKGQYRGLPWRLYILSFTRHERTWACSWGDWNILEDPYMWLFVGRTMPTGDVIPRTGHLLSPKNENLEGLGRYLDCCHWGMHLIRLTCYQPVTNHTKVPAFSQGHFHASVSLELRLFFASPVVILRVSAFLGALSGSVGRMASDQQVVPGASRRTSIPWVWRHSRGGRS